MLVRSSTRYLGLFRDLGDAGLGTPTQVAWSTRDGPRAFAAGQTHDATGLEENWLLVWFSGAAGWTNWDSPWAVFLQHKPRWLRLDERGLHLEFNRQAGDVVVLPLYGHEKLPAAGQPPPPGRDRKAPVLRTSEWNKAIPRDALTRLRFWAGATRQFPIACEESYQVDRARDRVTFRSRFTWRSIPDDWGTPPMKLAPVSPALGLAAREPAFPAGFSRKPFDMEQPTPFGPLLAVAGEDGYDVSLPVLQFVNETVVDGPADPKAHPLVASALAGLPKAVAASASAPGGLSPAQLGRALPFLDPATRAAVVARLRALVESRSPLAVEAAWALVLQGESVDWVRQRWPDLRALWHRPGGEAGWAGFGNTGETELTAAPARAAALARLAWVAGDAVAYRESAAQFARTLVQLWAVARGAEWFREHQPWRTPEPFPAEVFITGWDAAGGWSLGGPAFPAAAPDARWTRRWQGAPDPDVARFCREYLPVEVRRELAWLEGRSPGGTPWQAGADGRPSFLEWRALLAPAPLESLAAGTPAEALSGGAPAVAGTALALLRASRPGRQQRLIPGGEPGPFLALPPSGVTPPSLGLGTALAVDFPGAGAGPGRWPELTWPAWKAPGGARPWSFGRVQPVRDGAPPALRRVVLSGGTQVIVGALP